MQCLTTFLKKLSHRCLAGSLIHVRICSNTRIFIQIYFSIVLILFQRKIGKFPLIFSGHEERRIKDPAKHLW